MKKNESLMVTLLSIYAILLTISIALYALIKEFEMDVALTTNLLLWSATLFAPIAVLMTYTSWKVQKRNEELSLLAKTTLFELKKLTNVIQQNWYLMKDIESGVKILEGEEMFKISQQITNEGGLALDNIIFVNKEYWNLLDCDALFTYWLRVNAIQSFWSSKYFFGEINYNWLEYIESSNFSDLEIQVEETLRNIAFYKF